MSSQLQIVLLLVASFASGRSLACELPPEDAVLMYLEGIVRTSTLVADATVDMARFDTTTKEEIATLTIDRIYKGAVSSPLRIKHVVAMCMARLPVGERVYLFLTFAEGQSTPNVVAHLRRSRAPDNFEETLEQLIASAPCKDDQ